MRPALLAPLAAAVLTACSGGPGADPATARALAQQAEEVASTLAAGDTCRAAVLADGLHERARQAVGGMDLDQGAADELVTVTGMLASEITCPPPSPSPSGDEEDDRDRGDRDGDDDDDGGRGDRDGRGPDGRGPPGLRGR